MCWCRLPRRRHSLTTSRLVRSLNVTAMTVSPDPKIANAGVSTSVTSHGIASSVAILDSRRLDDPESVCKQRSHWRRTAVNFCMEALFFGLFDESTGGAVAAWLLPLQAHSPSDYLLPLSRPLSK